MRLRLLISKENNSNFGIGKKRAFLVVGAKGKGPVRGSVSFRTTKSIGSAPVLCCVVTCTLIFLLCFWFLLGNAVFVVEVGRID